MKRQAVWMLLSVFMFLAACEGQTPLPMVVLSPPPATDVSTPVPVFTPTLPLRSPTATFTPLSPTLTFTPTALGTPVPADFFFCETDPAYTTCLTAERGNPLNLTREAALMGLRVMSFCGQEGDRCPTPYGVHFYSHCTGDWQGGVAGERAMRTRFFLGGVVFAEDQVPCGNSPSGREDEQGNCTLEVAGFAAGVEGLEVNTAFINEGNYYGPGSAFYHCNFWFASYPYQGSPLPALPPLTSP